MLTWLAPVWCSFGRSGRSAKRLRPRMQRRDHRAQLAPRLAFGPVRCCASPFRFPKVARMKTSRPLALAYLIHADIDQPEIYDLFMIGTEIAGHLLAEGFSRNEVESVKLLELGDAFLPTLQTAFTRPGGTARALADQRVKALALVRYLIEHADVGPASPVWRERRGLLREIEKEEAARAAEKHQRSVNDKNKQNARKPRKGGRNVPPEQFTVFVKERPGMKHKQLMLEAASHFGVDRDDSTLARRYRAAKKTI